MIMIIFYAVMIGLFFYFEFTSKKNNKSNNKEFCNKFEKIVEELMK